jgi:hypothetical protein
MEPARGGVAALSDRETVQIWLRALGHCGEQHVFVHRS